MLFDIESSSGSFSQVSSTDVNPEVGQSKQSRQVSQVVQVGVHLGSGVSQLGVGLGSGVGVGVGCIISPQ
jgi:hypothetical protein